MTIIEWKKNRAVLYSWLLLLFICSVALLDVLFSAKGFMELAFVEQKMLLASNNRGHVSVILLFWVFPIYSFLLFSERLIKERTSNLFIVEALRTSKKKIFLGKCLTNALMLSLFFLLALILNFVTVSIFLPVTNATFDWRYAEMLEVFPSWNNLGYWVYEHPSATYLLYMILLCGILFTMSFFVAALSLVFYNRKIVYPVSMTYWLIWWFVPYDLSMSIQPFTEYGLSYAVMNFLLFTSMTSLLTLILVRRYLSLDYL